MKISEIVFRKFQKPMSHPRIINVWRTLSPQTLPFNDSACVDLRALLIA